MDFKEISTQMLLEGLVIMNNVMGRNPKNRPLLQLFFDAIHAEVEERNNPPREKKG